MARLTIRVLGSLHVSINDAPVTTLESDKVRALLVYLAVESNSPHRRETLAGLLWPDYPEDSARHSLRQALFNLRQSLEDHAVSPSHFIVTRDAIQFNRASDFTLDVDQFNQLYSAADLRRNEAGGGKFTLQLEEMVKLYQGEFLQQFFLEDSAAFEQWAVVQREGYHQRALEVHRFLSSYYETQGDYKPARHHASRLLELDPWREEAHRQLMRVLALSGERSAALEQYETCRRVLAQELDVEPSTGTRELYEQIRSGKLTSQNGHPHQAPDLPKSNLPVQLTPFIGREAELTQLGQLISDPDCRCITLVGPGGIGKTRLAIQAAGEYFNHFDQGVVFIRLAPVGSIAGVVPAIANAMKIAFFGPDDPMTQLLAFLRGKQVLLVVDNVEHLLQQSHNQENIAGILVEILRNAPKVKLLVTSREALNLQEEWLFEVQGLAFPETDQVDEFDQYDAVALFVQRARRAFPGFALSEENSKDISHICRLVEGMPLAIELAATWMRSLSPVEIAQEIEKSLDFLSVFVHDIPERHRSVRAVFDYSWKMLSTEEQQVLRYLSVFRGGFHRQAAEQVAGASLSILSTLVNRTLIRRSINGRYDQHELVRQYCATQLASNPTEKDSVRERHSAYYLGLAEAANHELQGQDQLEWLTRLDQEHDNLRVALEWVLDHDDPQSESGELALRLSAALRWYWRMRGHFHEGCDWIAEALQKYPGRRTEARACALLGLSLLLNGLGDLGAARAPVEESVSIYRDLGLQDGLAEALLIEGLTLLWQGEGDAGQRHTREALEIYRNIGNRWGEAQALYRLGCYLEDFGGAIEGRVMLEESASILKSFEEKFLYTSVLLALSLVDLKLGNYTEAQKRFEASLAASREIKHPWGIADALTNMGCLSRIRGNYAQAQSHFEEAFQVYQEHGHNVWKIDVLCAMSENDIVQGNFNEARLRLQMANSLLGNSKNTILHILVAYFRGLLAYYEGDLLQAAELLEKTVELAQTSQFKPDLARALVTLGWVKLEQGSADLAIQLMLESLGVFRAINNKLGYAISLEALAAASVVKGDEAEAVRLFSASETLRQELGAPLPPIDRDNLISKINTSRSRLGDAVFMDLWAQSSARSIEEVVEERLNSERAS